MKEKEPEIYASIYGKAVLPPSTIIKGIMGQGLYLKIKDKSILEEIKKIDDNGYKYVLLPWAIFITFLFYSLFIRAIVN